LEAWFQVWIIETGVECRLVDTEGWTFDVFSNHYVRVLIVAGKYGLAPILSSKRVKALVRPI
jgi:hypothetical protein